MKFLNMATYIQDKTLIDKVRPAHKAYLATLAEEGVLLASGPFVDGSGALMVYEADNIDHARSLARNDPFSQEGVFASYDIKEWKLVYVDTALLTASAG